MRISAYLLVLPLLAVLLYSCSGGRAAMEQPASGMDADGPGLQTIVLPGSGFPEMLPQDRLQPWEEGLRAAAGIDSNSDFTAGRDWFADGGSGVSENGEAARIEAPAAGYSFAIWRIPLDGQQPGTLSLDVNLLGNGAGQPSRYQVGIADYANGRWSWHGPFTDSHVRLSTGTDLRSGSGFLSSVGNSFICVLVDSGNRVDVVGVGMNPYMEEDLEAPGTPGGLTAMPVAGGLELQWNPVIADDLAGYRVFHSNRSFISPHSAGVRQLDGLEGSTRLLLPSADRTSYVRIAAVDHNGNEGPASLLVSARPLAGSIPELHVETDLTGGPLGSIANLSFSGADSYDVDSDGDGIFEITGDTSGSTVVDTGNTGIIRPRVRASSSSGEAVALGAVSLVITGNTRPLASATASPQTGPAPLLVTFRGKAIDEEDAPDAMTYAWDFNGDGFYEPATNSLDPPLQTYTEAGLHNVKFRVTDSLGASDIDTISVLVTEGPPDGPLPPQAAITADPAYGTEGMLVSLDASGSIDSDGEIVLYEFDYDGDGFFDAYSTELAVSSHHYESPGLFHPQLRVTDNFGNTSTASAEVRVNEELNLHTAWPGFGRDRRNNRRTTIVGPQDNGLTWSYNTGTNIDTSPAIGPDGTIYICGTGSQLHAVNPDGSQKWTYVTSGSMESSPAVGRDGTVYVGSWDDKLYAIRPDGSLKWYYTTGGNIECSPAIGDDGVVYVGSWDNMLHAIYPSGKPKWTVELGTHIRSTPAIADDGTMYLGNQFGTVFALSHDGAILWEYDTEGSIEGSAAIGVDGSIYIGSSDGFVYALLPDGSLDWKFQTGGSIVYSSPAIGLDGTIYIGGALPMMYAINPDGTQKWRYSVGGYIGSAPAIGGDGKIYFGSNDEYVYCLTPDGELDWSFRGNDFNYCGPAIGYDGTLYIGGIDNHLHAFGATL